MNEIEFEKKEEQPEAPKPEDAVNETVTEETATADEVSTETMTAVESVVAEVSSADESAVTQEAPAELPPVPAEEKPLWNFAIQAEEDRKKAKKKGAVGALVYAIIMTCLFAVCFAVLAVLLITGYGSDDEGNNNGQHVVIDTSNLVNLVESVQGSVVTVKVSTANGTGFGSGFVYSDQGHIITNYHVIDNAKRIIVVCHDGRTHEAELIDGDELSDVAVILVKDLGVPSLPVGDSDALRVGEDVIAIGTPVDTEYAGTVTKGIISGVKRKVRVYEEAGYLSKTMEMIQTDTTLNHGNSGGPLINMRGEVIGINTMKYYAYDAGDTLYFSIPINDVVEIADDIIQNGKYSGDKGSASQGVQLGISGTTAVKGEPIRIDQTNSVTPEVDGVLIVSVSEGYAAYGKLEMYDIVVSFDGVPTTTIEGLRAELFKHKVGDTVTLEVWRDGKIITVDITL